MRIWPKIRSIGRSFSNWLMRYVEKSNDTVQSPGKSRISLARLNLTCDCRIVYAELSRWANRLPKALGHALPAKSESAKRLAQATYDNKLTRHALLSWLNCARWRIKTRRAFFNEESKCRLKPLLHLSPKKPKAVVAAPKVQAALQDRLRLNPEAVQRLRHRPFRIRSLNCKHLLHNL